METGRVLVLGGSGFLGRQVCASIVRGGWPVIGVSRHPTRLAGTRWLTVDLATADHATLSRLLELTRPSVVVNAAGAVWGVSEEQLVASNVTLVRRLVRAVAAQPWRPRLLHLGSVHEYGRVEPGEPILESTPLRPVSPYGRTKMRGSRLVLDACRSGAVDGLVLRLVNVTGPGTPSASLLGTVADELLSAAAAGRTAVLRLAPLRAQRDFVDVRDIADAMDSAARSRVTGRAVNIGRGEAVSVRWLVHRLIAASGVPAEVVERDGPEPAGASRSGVDWQRVDIDAARSLLGWSPGYELEDSLRALWSYACRRVTGSHTARKVLESHRPG